MDLPKPFKLSFCLISLAVLTSGCDVDTAFKNALTVYLEVDTESIADYLTESRFHADKVDLSDPLLNERIIVVSNQIQEFTSHEVSTKLLYLNSKNPDKPIDLYLKTYGGWSNDAFAIIDVMRSIDAPVNVYAMGYCASAGTMILVAATGERVALPRTTLNVHIHFECDDTASDWDRINRVLETELYRSYTRVPEAWLEGCENNSFDVSGAEAVELGLIDRIASDHPNHAN